MDRLVNGIGIGIGGVYLVCWCGFSVLLVTGMNGRVIGGRGIITAARCTDQPKTEKLKLCMKQRIVNFTRRFEHNQICSTMSNHH